MFSIVTTLYRSSPWIMEFYERMSSVVRQISNEYEIIFVDDGSPDNSLEIAKDIAGKDHKVKVIELSRNFGHHKALMTGLSYAKGDLIFVIDCDLEEAPELLLNFYDKMLETSSDVMYGVQKKRKGGWFERLTGYIFYSLMDFLSSVKIPRNLLTVRLMKRDYVNKVLSYQEKVLYIHGVWCSAGFKQTSVEVKKLDKGSTTYNFRRKLALALDIITSFSEKPLVYLCYVGLFILLVSFFAMLIVIFRKIFFGIDLIGWSSLIVSVWFFGGLMLSSMGLLGLYIARIFLEVKSRPLTIVRNVFCCDVKDGG